MRPVDSRTDILRAARNAFADKGYNGASIRDIAQGAGLSLSGLYYYFPSKQHALFELLRSAYDWYLTNAAEVIEGAGDQDGDRVSSLVRFIVRYRANNRLIGRIVVRDAERLSADKFAQIRKLQRASRKVLIDLIHDGKQSGAFAVENPELAGQAILSIVNAIPFWYKDTGALDTSTLERSYAAYCLRILGYQGLAADLPPASEITTQH